MNLINLPGNRLAQRPGIDAFSDGPGICRGSTQYKGKCYQVSGDKLVRINIDGTVDALGDIPGSAQCAIAVGAQKMVVVVKGAGGYVYDIDAGLSQITSPNYQPSIDVAHIDGRFVFVPADGGPLFFSDVDNPFSIGNASYFDAELLPDNNLGVKHYKNRLYVLGEDSCEMFRHKGANPSAPFLRSDGAAVFVGYVAAHVEYSESFALLGKEKEGSYGIFIMSAGEAPRISSGPVDRLLNREYTPDELKTCLSQRLQWDEADMILFRLPRHTLVFANGSWTFFKTEQGGAWRPNPWRVSHITPCYGKFIVGDALSGKIGVLSESDADYGEQWPRLIQTFYRALRGQHFTIDSLTLDTHPGQSSSLNDDAIGLSVSTDGHTWGQTFYTPLGKQGQYSADVNWEYPGGLGDFESFAGLRFLTYAPVELSTDGLYAEVS